ncbi:MAG: hypothetical protein WDO16_01850 [Bacteroidota bacterium]
MQRICLVLVLIFISMSYGASGQKKEELRLTASFSKLSLPEFVQRIERLTPYRFYYDPSQLPADTVDISVQDEPLQKILERVFAKSGDTCFNGRAAACFPYKKNSAS